MRDLVFQKENVTMVEYDLIFKEHVHNIVGPLRQLSLPMQWLKCYKDLVISFNIMPMASSPHLSNYFNLWETSGCC